MGHHHKDSKFVPLKIAVLTVSDSRTFETDDSGQLLADSLQQAGHVLAARDIRPDDIYQLRAIISNWIADPEVEAVLVTGGTGLTGRDNAPEALHILFDRDIEGFGELFRAFSYEEISTSAIQSRAFAGLANGTAIFCMPGSPKACRLGWDKIISAQLDGSQGPCNLVCLMPRFLEQ
jgi:molybdenum cofactor biosynthesis protein B